MNVTHDFDQLIDSFSFPPRDFFYTTSLFLSYLVVMCILFICVNEIVDHPWVLWLLI